MIGRFRLRQAKQLFSRELEQCDIPASKSFSQRCKACAVIHR
jgi:hypothetical protein